MQRLGKQKDRQPFCLSWDIVLFFALYAVSPAYLGLDLHTALPVLSLSRAVLTLMAVMLIWRRRQNLSLKNMNLGLTGEQVLRWGLIVFFALILVCDLVAIPEARSHALKGILNFLVEGYAIILLMTLLLDSRKKLSAAIKILVYACGVISFIAIISCIVDLNLFHLLKTVNRKMLMSNYYRLGVLRASASFGHPVYYGAFCAVILPLNMFFYEHGKDLKEKLFLGSAMTMTLIGLILCNSRGSLVAAALVIFLIFLGHLLNRQFKHFMLHYLPIVGAVALCMLALVFLLPNGKTLFSGIWNSLVNILPGKSASQNSGNADHSTDATTPGGSPSDPTTPSETVPVTTETVPATTAPSNKPEYGENASGMNSRMKQLTGIEWTLKHKPLFGFGPNAHTRGLIRYEFVAGKWWVFRTFDMGIVSVFCQYGILGTIGYGALYCCLLFTTIRKKYRKDPLMNALMMALVAFFLCLLTISSLDSAFWLIAGFIVCLTNIILRETSPEA